MQNFQVSLCHLSTSDVCWPEEAPSCALFHNIWMKCGSKGHQLRITQPPTPSGLRKESILRLHCSTVGESNQLLSPLEFPGGRGVGGGGTKSEPSIALLSRELLLGLLHDSPCHPPTLHTGHWDSAGLSHSKSCMKDSNQICLISKPLTSSTFPLLHQTGSPSDSI